jgi:DNA-directed RNA polymerase subunit RPC12/RpoP
MAAKAGWPRLFTTLVDCPHCGARIDFDAATHTAPLGENRSLRFFVCTACDRKFRIDSEAERDAALLVAGGLFGGQAIAWFLPGPWKTGFLLISVLSLPSYMKIRQWFIRPRP